ncbi:MAG: hypothetical protein L0G06_09955, partial [Enterobacterales bacterium]|nr:hypothetical protein [Enterobacterales bacterium]
IEAIGCFIGFLYYFKFFSFVAKGLNIYIILRHGLMGNYSRNPSLLTFLRLIIVDPSARTGRLRRKERTAVS